MTQIALYVAYKDWLGNRIFDLANECNRNDVAVRWIALRESLAERGYDLNTYDTYTDQKKIDYWLMIDPWESTLKYLWYYRVNPKRVMMMLHEPQVINPWGWKHLRWYAWMMRGILTWHSDLCRRNSRFHQYHFPCSFDRDACERYRRIEKDNFALMMHSNKMSPERGQLYSLRREIIRYYENRGDDLLNLYGYGWNDPNDSDPFHTTIHRGVTDDKMLTYAQHQFVFCIDNSIVPGYVTYDPLIAMAAGAVPIYKPMPDSMKLIPENTFVNYDRFDSHDDLTRHLQALIASGEVETVRRRGWDFIWSEQFEPFTIERFCREMCDGIEACIGSGAK